MQSLNSILQITTPRQKYEQQCRFLNDVAATPRQIVYIPVASKTSVAGQKAPITVSGMGIVQFRHCIGLGFKLNSDVVLSRGQRQLVSNFDVQIVTLRDYPGTMDAVTQPKRDLTFSDLILVQNQDQKTEIAFDNPESLDFNDPDSIGDQLLEIGTALSWAMSSYACAKSKNWKEVGLQAKLAESLDGNISEDFPFYYGGDIWSQHQESTEYMPVPYAYLEPHRTEGWVQTTLSRSDTYFNGFRSFLLHAKKRFPIYAPFTGVVKARTENQVTLRSAPDGEIPDLEESILLLSPDNFHFGVGDRFAAGEVLGFGINPHFDVSDVEKKEQLITEVNSATSVRDGYARLLEDYLRSQIVYIGSGAFVPANLLPSGQSWIPQKREIYWDFAPTVEYHDPALDTYIVPPMPFSRESVRINKRPIHGIIDLSIN